MHTELTNDLSSISGWKNSGIFFFIFFEMDLAFPSGFSSGGWFPYRVTNVALAECFPVFSNTMQPRATRQHIMSLLGGCGRGEKEFKNAICDGS